MTQEEAFLQNILANPQDDVPRLVFADWLEERGDPRAPFVRAHPEIYRLIAGMRASTKNPNPFEQLGQYAADGRADLLLGLSLALRALVTDQRFNLAFPGILQSVLDRVERLLALSPGLPDAEAFLRWACPSSSPPESRRRFASFLASGQSAEVLLGLLERYGDEEECFELLACLTQEMVLRGRNPGACQVTRKMQQRGHPLAGLPFSLMGIESEVGSYLPNYKGDSSGHALPFGPTGLGGVQPRSGTDTAPPGFSEVTTPETAAAISSAVLNWEEESNGRSEARVFRLDRPVAGDDVSAALLQSLGLESLQGAGDEDIWMERVRPHIAFNKLFSAACCGGAYNNGLRGAYGRLAAWQSLAGLVGAPEGASVEEVADLAERCSWVSAYPNTEWFDRVAWDFFLAAVRPGGLSLAVLAATDTD